MYSLFAKIFLSFWVATLAMGAVIAFATAQLGGEKIPPMIERAHNHFDEDVGRAVAVLSGRGVDALRQWLDERGNARSMRLAVFDATGREVLGQRLSDPLRRFAQPFDPQAQPPGPVRERRVLRVHIVQSVEGEIYRLVALFRPPHPVWHLFTLPGLLGAIAFSALVCLALARYLSAPIRRLRTATQALAAGDLETRVGSLARRRDEMGGLGRDFDRMAERLQRLIENQRRLLRDVSHELRSPLARLQAALGLARQQTAGAADAQFDRIEREAERLEELIGQVLSLTRLAAGEGTPGGEVIDLAAIVRAIADDAAFEAAQRGCTVALGTVEPVAVEGDAELLHRAIENIVRNAVHHSPGGSAVGIALRRDGGSAVVTVRDRGTGVGASEIERIFDPFYRASEARERTTGGYGLGLAIARSAVERHGGSIAAANAPGGGLEVTVRLPAHAGEGDTAGA